MATKERIAFIKMEKRIKQKAYSREYYEKNRYKIAKHMVEQYLPEAIEKLHEKIPEKIAEYYEIYKYDEKIEKYTNCMLVHYGVSREKSFYQDCLSNTYLGYLYSVGRCAYKGYTGIHVVNYIKLMIRNCIIYGINTSNEVGQISKELNLRVVYLDDDLKAH